MKENVLLREFIYEAPILPPTSRPAGYMAHYASYSDIGLKVSLPMFLLALLQVLKVCYS